MPPPLSNRPLTDPFGTQTMPGGFHEGTFPALPETAKVAAASKIKIISPYVESIGILTFKDEPGKHF